MKESFIGLKKNYRIRKSLFVFIFRFIASQLIFALLFFALNLFLTWTHLLMVMFMVNILVVISLFVYWYVDYYIISSKSIVHTKGIILKRTESYDLKSIRSVKIVEPFLYLFFRYGDIVLESPLFSHDIYIKKLQNPYKHAKVIESQRLKWLEGDTNQITPIV